MSAGGLISLETLDPAGNILTHLIVLALELEPLAVTVELGTCIYLDERDFRIRISCYKRELNIEAIERL